MLAEGEPRLLLDLRGELALLDRCEQPGVPEVNKFS